MKVFISWSGVRSRAVAMALSDLLPDLIQEVDTWMSEHHIAAGSRWSAELNRELEESRFGILCLTPENLNVPWLLFEAGSLAKSIASSRVVPYRLDLQSTDIMFPLAQFQGVDANREGTHKLVVSLNSALEEPLVDERLRRVFDRWWPDLEGRLASVPGAESTPTRQREDRELLEEILQLARKDQSGRQGYDDYVQKDAVWKMLHDVTDSDLEAMSTEALREFSHALHARWKSTGYVGEERALEMRMDKVQTELVRRGESVRPDRAEDDQ